MSGEVNGATKKRVPFWGSTDTKVTVITGGVGTQAVVRAPLWWSTAISPAIVDPPQRNRKERRAARARAKSR